MRTSRYSTVDTNFRDFAENRGAGFLRQFKEVFVRNWLFLNRNRRALGGIIFNSFFIALIMLSIYWHVADFPDLVGIAATRGVAKAQSDYATYVMNIRGLAFMLSNQLSISASQNAILQVPLQAPVMKRELANKMYSPSAYFLGRFISNCIM